MQSLNDFLTHPYLILNRLAESIYGASGAAINQRLRARVQGRHRYTKDDYRALRKEALAFANKLDSIANKIDREAPKAQPSSPWLKLIHHPWLNHKHLIVDVAGEFQLSYTQAYDGLRGRSQLPKGFFARLAKQYRNMADFARKQFDLAKKEKSHYPFSHGKGGASHLPNPGKGKN